MAGLEHPTLLACSVGFLVWRGFAQGDNFRKLIKSNASNWAYDGVHKKLGKVADA
jgi:hypothetical protein